MSAEKRKLPPPPPFWPSLAAAHCWASVASNGTTSPFSVALSQQLPTAVPHVALCSALSFFLQQPTALQVSSPGPQALH